MLPLVVTSTNSFATIQFRSVAAPTVAIKTLRSTIVVRRRRARSEDHHTGKMTGQPRSRVDRVSVARPPVTPLTRRAPDVGACVAVRTSVHVQATKRGV